MKSKPGDWHISSLAHIPELLALYYAEHFSHALIKPIAHDGSMAQLRLDMKSSLFKCDSI